MCTVSYAELSEILRSAHAVYVCVYVSMYIYMYVCMCIYIYIYTHTYMSVCVYMYVCISEQRLFQYEAVIGFYKGDGVFTARYELNL